MLRHRNQAINPEKFMPRILATPVRRPMVASWPSVENRNGFFCAPRMAATMFFPTWVAWRIACCAVGGCGLPVLRLRIQAQSPTAHTPGKSGTSRFLSTTRRPFSFLQGKLLSTEAGVTPAVQINVAVFYGFSAAQFHSIAGKAEHASTGLNLDSPLAEFLLRIKAQVLAEFGF